MYSLTKSTCEKVNRVARLSLFVFSLASPADASSGEVGEARELGYLTPELWKLAVDPVLMPIRELFQLPHL